MFWVNRRDLHMNFKENSRTGSSFSDHFTVGLGGPLMSRAAQPRQDSPHPGALPVYFCLAMFGKCQHLSKQYVGCISLVTNLTCN